MRAMMSKAAALAMTLVLALAMGLAAGCGASSSKTVQETRTTTKGQELLDLKKAYDQGVISEKEYEKSKKKIMDKD